MAIRDTRDSVPRVPVRDRDRVKTWERKRVGKREDGEKDVRRRL